MAKATTTRRKAAAKGDRFLDVDAIFAQMGEDIKKIVEERYGPLNVQVAEQGTAIAELDDRADKIERDVAAVAREVSTLANRPPLPPSVLEAFRRGLGIK